MTTKILVTGGSGTVGKALQKIMPVAAYVSSEDYNLLDQGDVEYMFMHHKPEVVVHMAARVGGIQDNLKHPANYFYENTLMNTLVVDCARRNKVKQFIGLLSTCVYPDVASSYPMKEEQLHEGKPTATNFSYGYAKRAMAVHIDTLNAQYNTNYQYLIPCNIYGVDDAHDEQKSHFLGALIKKIHAAVKTGDNSISLLGTGIAMRQFMIADDLAAIIKSCVDNNITESFNVCPDENISIKDIAHIALQACDAQHLQIEWDSTKPDGQLNKEAGNAKLKALFPDFNFTSLSDGIKKVYQKLG